MAPEKPAFDPSLLVLYASSPRFDAVLSLEFQQNTLLIIIMEYSNDRIFIPFSSSQKESKSLLVNEKEKEKKEV